MPEGDRQEPSEPAKQPPKPPEKPEYNVYRSRRRLSDVFRKPDLAGLRGRLGRGERPPPSVPGEPEHRPWWRVGLKWFGIAALVWLVLSFLAFAISAQIQKWKLADGVTNAL